MLLCKADCGQFESLINYIENFFSHRTDQYPTTVTAVYELLIAYRRESSNKSSATEQETGDAFMQHTTVGGGRVPGNCNATGNRGGAAQGRGQGQEQNDTQDDKKINTSGRNQEESPTPGHANAKSNALGLALAHILDAL